MCHAASGVEAFTELGLPKFADLVRKGLDGLKLSPEATADQIDAAARQIADIDRFLDEAEPIETEIEQNADQITKAVSKYIRQHADRLWRA